MDTFQQSERKGWHTNLSEREGATGWIYTAAGFLQSTSAVLLFGLTIKGIVHFEINVWYVLAYLEGIQDVGVFVSTVFSI